MTRFINLVDATDKAAELKYRISNQADGIFDVDMSTLSTIPGTPFAYWVTSQVLSIFGEYPTLSKFADAWVGLQTNDDFRWVRLWWEECAEGSPCRGVPFAKGGARSPYYADVYLVVRWGDRGRWIKEWKNDQLAQGKITANNSKCWNENQYFRPGVTWPSRTQEFGPRALPHGCIFAHKGPALFPQGSGEDWALSLLGVANSRGFKMLLETRLNAADAGARSFEVGIVRNTPIPELTESVRDRFAALALQAWCLGRSLDLSVETSHAFVLPEALSGAVSLPVIGSVRQTLSQVQTQIDELSFVLYKLENEDRASIDRMTNVGLADGADAQPEAEEDVSANEDALVGMQSWAVGVAFGRFDPRLATGERTIPSEPDPFDPLPAKSPGMLPNGDAPFMPTSGVFVDDPGHAEDLCARVTAVYERVGEAPPAPDELRKAFAKEFFPAHIRMYSRSRRKAPIYWQLATPSVSYSVWLYIHAFGKDTLFRVQNDYVAPKLAHERRELEGLMAEAGPSPTTAQNRAIEAQSTFVEELSSLLDEVRRVAPLWDPDLDDGVILNFAPLWRLVPQNRAWQKELRAAWASLVAGDYDWAHLSMRLWPERVVPKCAKDRSLAIAHDLEDVFWFEDAAGKWQARPAPTRPLDELIAERTSPAVRAALQSLLDAPDPVAASGRGRRKKS